MPATYDSIATTTLGSPANSITFSSISASYTDLRLVLYGIGTGSSTFNLRLNGDAGSNYSRTFLSGNGSNVLGFQENNTSGGTEIASLSGAGLTTVDIFSYTNSVNKTMLTVEAQDRNGSGYSRVAVNLWRNTAAINTILIYGTFSSNFSAGTTATLYGILRA